MQTLAAIAIGGGCGSILRYLLSAQITRWMGSGFPFGTLAVNILGCFVMGLFVELFALRWTLSSDMRALLTTGLLGGFTTFSAFSLEAALLYERGQVANAALYCAASVLLSIGALFAAIHLVRWGHS